VRASFFFVEFRAIDLKGRVSSGASIEFLRVEVPAGEYHGPFALIRYALHGVEQEYGLRLDMDKRVILDHFEEEELESAVQKAAPKIVEYVGSVLYPRENQIPWFVDRSSHN
jgi:hypothetical protein